MNQELKNKYDYKLILGLLIIDETDNYDFFCYKYKTSNQIKEKFKNISKNFNNLKDKKFYTEKNIKKLIYYNGKDAIKDILLFSTCANNKLKNFDIEKLLNYVNDCEIPKFPVSGDDLKRYGYKSGLELGKKLKTLESKWIDDNFFIDIKLLEKNLDKAN